MAIERTSAHAIAFGVCFVMLSAVASAQQRGQTTPPPSVTQPVETARGSQNRFAAPQGFSVVLVLGDIQAASPSDDVPVAARKALTDMKDFLPYKSYRLLDAAWLLCCGQDVRRGEGESTLRGPEGQEYDLKLMTSRGEGGALVVRFWLGGSEADVAVVADGDAAAIARRLADAQDRKTLLETQLQEARKKFEVGVAPKAEVTKLEMELRSEQRKIEDLTTRAARGSAATAGGARAYSRGRTVLDTTFTMAVGETVVVGTSRLKGGSKALIALLTAVPPRSGTAPKEE